MRREMAEQGYTMRSLADRTRECDGRGRGLSNGYLASLAKGRRLEVPSVETLELVAAALGVDPLGIVEYRLALVRRALDPREVGIEAATAALELVWGPLAAAADEGALADEFARALEEAAGVPPAGPGEIEGDRRARDGLRRAAG